MGIPSSDVLLKQIRDTVDVAWRNGLELSVIEKWLNNFSGRALGDKEQERNLALWMLYNFTYFNEEEVKHLCKLMLRKYLHSTLVGKKVKLDNINELLRKSRFMPLGKNSESGAYILYLFRQENDLPVSSFGDIVGGNSEWNYVFVDDMTLSGSQALRYVRRVKYAGYEIKEEDLKDSFLDRIKEREAYPLIKYISNYFGDGTLDKKHIVDIINEKVIRNTGFFSETRDLFNKNTFEVYLKNIIDKYNEDASKLDNIVIYKMNRLLLENYFKEDIKIGINNLLIKNWYLLSFIASKQAKQTLEDEKIKVINCIELDEMSKVFSKESMVFGDFQKEKEACQLMCEYYGKEIKPEYPLGYNNSQYLFGLYYTIPNNTLPIFGVTENWNPLFIRHEKNYGGKIGDVFGRYI